MGDRPAVSGRHGSARPARDGHGLRVRLDRLPTALRARCERRPGSVRGARGASPRPARVGRCRQKESSSSASATAATSARATSCGSTRSGQIGDEWVEKVRADFHDIHEREYSRRFEESDIELPNIRVRGIGLQPALELPEVERGPSRPGRRCGTKGGLVPGRRRPRPGADALLRPLGAPGGQPDRGPAIVNQYDSTTVIPPGISAHVDRYGNIVVEVGACGRGAGHRSGNGGHGLMSVQEYEVGRQPGPPTREAGRGRPDRRVLGGAFHAIAKEMAGVSSA